MRGCVIQNISIVKLWEDNGIVHELEGINWDYISQRSQHGSFGRNLFNKCINIMIPNAGSHLCTCQGILLHLSEALVIDVNVKAGNYSKSFVGSK